MNSWKQIILMAILFISVLFFSAQVNAQYGCQGPQDCPLSQGGNYCCGDNVCNDQYYGACDVYAGTCYTGPFMSALSHVDACSYGCCNGSCCPAPAPTDTPVPAPTSPPVVNECDTPGASCGACDALTCQDGAVCATGNSYCVYDAGGNYCGACQAEVNNCAGQCVGPTVVPTEVPTPTPTSAPGDPPPDPPPGDSCTASYSLNPAAPVASGTDVIVTFPSINTTNSSCLVLYQDNVAQLCWLEQPGNVLTCSVNSGAAGTRTLQLKYGQSAFYPGISCGNAVDCNSTTYAVYTPTCQVSGASCGTPGYTNVTLQGITVTDDRWGATGMRVARDGVTLVNQVPATATYADTNLTPGSTYSYDISCYNGSTITGTQTLSCSTPGSPNPAIGSLRIKECGTNCGNQGSVYKVSGLQTSENGRGYYNGLNVYPVVNDGGMGDNSNIALVATAFVGEGLGASPTLAQLMASADSSFGFVVVYAAKNVGPAQNIKISGVGQNFSQGKYYVYYNNQWKGPYDIGGNATLSSGIIIQIIDPDFGVTETTGPRFQVKFPQTLGSKKWNTYTKVIDAYQTTAVNGQNYGKEVTGQNIPVRPAN